MRQNSIEARATRVSFRINVNSLDTRLAFPPRRSVAQSVCWQELPRSTLRIYLHVGSAYYVGTYLREYGPDEGTECVHGMST